ncbi:MAG: hypothetical protein IBJ11_05230 [Phycisphaerales bacterium]|nr:hypothetical protein [Phycisphaerales bacterium]
MTDPSFKPLPAPAPLNPSLVLTIQLGPRSVRLLCPAATLVDLNTWPEVALPYWCLHVSAAAMPEGGEPGDQFETSRLVIPVQYISDCALGPEIMFLPRDGAEKNTIVLPPVLPPADQRLPLEALRAALREVAGAPPGSPPG